ncbi:MAG: kynureninase [Anaerolineales bacterium]|nr:kynureninase [Anaerolineales bacterium]
MPIRTDAAYARALDAADPLAKYRARFVMADPDLIYLDGNSLGRLPVAAQQLAVDVVTRQWGQQLIRSWNEGWFDAPARIGAKIAGLIGAQPDEVIVADATSINLFKLAVAALRHRRERRRILTDDLNFPSDLYILQGAIDLLERGHVLRVLQSPDGIHGPVEALATELAGGLADDVALVTLSHTVFKSGYTYDMAAVTRQVHAAGALTLWDLSHSVGAVPIDLNAAGADLAIGCTYKYLNGGPGAPAFLYVRRNLQERLLNPISGWWGQPAPFQFGLDYQPAQGMQRFLTGTAPITSLLMIEPGVDLLLEAGMDALRSKSIQQSEYLIGLWEAWLAPLGYRLNSPRDPAWRGSHISLGHEEGLRIDLALIRDLGVLPDFRSPDNIRLGIAPIYTTYADIHTAAARMQQVVADQLYVRYPAEKPAVT